MGNSFYAHVDISSNEVVDDSKLWVKAYPPSPISNKKLNDTFISILCRWLILAVFAALYKIEVKFGTQLLSNSEEVAAIILDSITFYKSGHLLYDLG